MYILQISCVYEIHIVQCPMHVFKICACALENLLEIMLPVSLINILNQLVSITLYYRKLHTL